VSKVFTIIYIFLGIGIIVLFVSTIAERATERRHGRADHAEDATAPDSKDALDNGSREADR